MRTCTITVCTVLLWSYSVLAECEPVPAVDKSEPTGPSAAALLREASEIALKQGTEQEYWTERLLLDIGKVQMRARDFEGLLRSIRWSTYSYGRNVALGRLAERLGRDGDIDGARAVLTTIDPGERPNHDELENLLRRWSIEHVIASGDLDGAGKAIEALDDRPAGFMRMLALACFKSGDANRAVQKLARAVDAAAKYPHGFGRNREIWEIGDAQLAVHAIDAAKATIRLLEESTESDEPWDRVAALREAGVLAFKANECDAAERLFRRAIEAHESLNAMNKIHGLHLIAIAQADAGDIDGARRTAAMIAHDDNDSKNDSAREEALVAIAVAQLRLDDVEGALRTALSITYPKGHRDEALGKIVEYHFGKRNLAAALLTSEKIANSSTKAVAVLKIAAAHAKAGDCPTAADVASRVRLTSYDPFSPVRMSYRFDYRSPRTWGVIYEHGFTMASTDSSHQQSAKIAAAAMTLAHALRQKTLEPYDASFANVREEEVIRALARAHTVSGDVSEALAWARRIGSDGKVASEDDFTTLWAIGQRISALVGVAEGILDRSKEAPAEGEP